MSRPLEHVAIAAAKVGVLLVNLGTPDAPSASAVRRYLAEFLSDRRVVELPAIVWQPILRGIVLLTRPAKSAKLYAKVWDHARGGSPLALFTADQSLALQGAWGGGVVVDYAMRYGNPSIPLVIDRLRTQGVERLLVAPLYPQYSAATTATVMDAVGAHLGHMRWQPALRTLPPYYDDPAYIDALVQSVRTHLSGLAWKPEMILMSFHGMPRVTLIKGDPYHCHCAKTARLLREALGLELAQMTHSFQSRFGAQEWLKPYSIEKVAELAKNGVKKLVLVAPGFSADCLETLEEIQLGLAEAFHQHGGTDFSYIPCLNASAPGVELIQHLIGRELQGWLA